MRKLIVAGNWKMNKSLNEGIELINEINEKLKSKTNDALVIYGTPFIHLAEAGKMVDNKSIFLSAQNCAAEASGAYTGEVSASMVASTGAQYVILGHSERRAYYNDNDEVLTKKVDQALSNQLNPIFCIGEVLDERESENHFNVVKAQMENVAFKLSADDFKKLVIAYEPVWAIGTGKTATSDQAQEMHAFIRGLIREKYGEQVADDTTILYGGSCKPSNANELFSNPDVDGGLIGGASLKADDFVGIINAL